MVNFYAMFFSKVNKVSYNNKTIFRLSVKYRLIDILTNKQKIGFITLKKNKNITT